MAAPKAAYLMVIQGSSNGTLQLFYSEKHSYWKYRRICFRYLCKSAWNGLLLIKLLLLGCLDTFRIRREDDWHVVKYFLFSQHSSYPPSQSWLDNVWLTWQWQTTNQHPPPNPFPNILTMNYQARLQTDQCGRCT